MFIKVFVNFKEESLPVIKSGIERSFNISLNNNLYFKSNKISLEVRKNEEFDLSKAIVFPDGFLYFSNYVEIELFEQIDSYILQIGNLLKIFWENNLPAIAACDFEDKLPNKGGYNNSSVPWVRLSE